MKKLGLVLIPLCFAALIFGYANCGGGSGPETVIVPVGEPGSGDPYDSNGDMACGSGTGAAQTAPIYQAGAATAVLVTLQGANDAWVFLLTPDEYRSLNGKLLELYGADGLAAINKPDIDRLKSDLCLPDDQRSTEGRRLVDIFTSVLKTKLDEMTAEVCN